MHLLCLYCALKGGLDATGYHAKRKEFDPEYDNDAEVSRYALYV